MPEGPELHLAGVFVNTVCAGEIFTGSVEKSAVSKCAEVPFSCDAYKISATSRGKEVRLTLTPIKTDTQRKGKPGLNQEPMHVVFRFGMSGYFSFTAKSEIPKHSHLRFYTQEDPQRVLNFVDVRRFGSWQPDGRWQKDRGPCVMLEYKSFRENVLSSLSDKAFDSPICEALLNQKYFNGIGNYLRAEILYRSHIPPFVKARTVLEGLEPHQETMNVKEEPSTQSDDDKADVDEKEPKSQDLLSLCHTVPHEVVNLGGKGYDPANKDYTAFVSWLQCYSIVGMNSVRDHKGRTIWFKGVPGPMAPKGSKSPKTKRKIKKDTDTKKEKIVKKETEGGKGENDMPKKQSSTRRRNATKNGLEAEVSESIRRRPNTRSSTGIQKTKTEITRRQKANSNVTSKSHRRSRRTT